MTRAGKALAWAGGTLAAMLAAGFLAFAVVVLRAGPPGTVTADGIVVLTGGEHRIAVGGDLLREQRAGRLLVSGVNRKLKPDDVRRLTGLGNGRFDCCVDIGYAALDTVGNAEEARAWAAYHGYRRLIVVTATYHMPRALFEFWRVMPDVEVVPHPVLPGLLRSDPWSRHLQAVRVLVGEYLKFVPAVARYALATVARSVSGPVTTARAGR